MNSNLKNYLLHLRDILQLMPGLPICFTFVMLKGWLMSFRFNMEKAVLLFRKKKHRIILDYLQKKYDSYLPQILNCPKCEDPSKLPIWILWWQGVELMPPLVKLCYESVKSQANTHPVYLLDKHNYFEYVNLPDFIMEKLENGFIKMANLSDIIRLKLLYDRGGFWMDATLFANSPISTDDCNPYFNSIRMSPAVKGTISDYRWASFYLFAYPHANTMKFFLDVMLAYFRDDHKRIIDYLLIDYTFQMLYERNEEFKHLVDAQPVGNEFTYSLVKILNQPYDENLGVTWQSMSKQTFFKLNWRIKLEQGNTMFHYLENLLLLSNEKEHMKDD